MSETSNGVWIPVGLYEAMAACFYGNGPNYWEKRGMAVPTPRPLEDRLPAGDEEDTSPLPVGIKPPQPERRQPVVPGQSFAWPGFPMSMRPMGAAAEEFEARFPRAKEVDNG